jgi:1-acyl-sn-glycerol-3-phosphate acyltransferase
MASLAHRAVPPAAQSADDSLSGARFAGGIFSRCGALPHHRDLAEAVSWPSAGTCSGSATACSGRENIPAEPSVVLAKHQSAWETVGLQEVFPPLVFVLKKELLRVPFFGWGLAAMKMISIDRAAAKDALKQVFDQGRERLSAGYWVVIFPEGTRVAPGETSRYKPGGAHLAVRSGGQGGSRGARRRRNLAQRRLRHFARTDHHQHRTADRPRGQDGSEDQRAGCRLDRGRNAASLAASLPDRAADAVAA